LNQAIEHYQRAWTLLERTAQAVPPRSWDAPSPCRDWTARQLAGHLVDGHRQVQAMLAGTGPLAPTSETAALTDLAGEDPAAALQDAAARVRKVLAGLDPAVEVVTPRGPLMVEQLLGMAVIEPFIHGWDLAVATGQPGVLDPELAGTLLPAVVQLDGQLAATGMYAPAVPLPDGAPAEARLLAALGRQAG